MSTRNLTRRMFLSSVVVTSLGVALAACAPKATPTPKPAEEPAAPAATAVPAAKEAVVVRFMSRAGAEGIPFYEKCIQEDFESKNPGIKVQIEPAPDGWVEKLLAQMIAGAAVDLFQAWGNIFYNWTERDLLLDCQPFVDRDMSDAEVAQYNDFQWEGLVMKGVRVGMPKYINLMTLTLNVEMWEKYGVDLPPEDGNYDHDDYAGWMKQLTESARSKGDEGVWGGWLPMWAWDRFWNHIHMFDGLVVDEKYGKKCMLGEEKAQAAFKWAYDLQWTNNYHAQPGQVENKWFRQALNAKFIMTAESGTYPISSDRDFQDAGIKWDLRHVPKGPTGRRSVLGTTDAWSITKQSKVREEAWAVLHFLAGPIFQEKVIVGYDGIIPVLKPLIDGFITKVREIQPTLEQVRLETIKEILDWGYAEDTPWFCDQVGATELIKPALEAVFTSGEEGPEYFIKVAKEVDATQQDCIS